MSIQNIPQSGRFLRFNQLNNSPHKCSFFRPTVPVCWSRMQHFVVEQTIDFKTEVAHKSTCSRWRHEIHPIIECHFAQVRLFPLKITNYYHQYFRLMFQTLKAQTHRLFLEFSTKKQQRNWIHYSSVIQKNLKTNKILYKRQSLKWIVCKVISLLLLSFVSRDRGTTEE